MDIRRAANTGEVEACAALMASSEPWITLGRGFDSSLLNLSDTSKELYVASHDGELIGFIVWHMHGAFVGYIQSVCVARLWRGRGFGTALLAFAEAEILKQSPNVFICVSSFNDHAQRLYDRLGYERVGELKNYLVQGHSEILLRKSIGSLIDFKGQG